MILVLGTMEKGSGFYYELHHHLYHGFDDGDDDFGILTKCAPKIIARSTSVSTAALVKVCFKTQINSTVCFFAYTRHKFVEIRNQLYKLMTCDGLFVCTESL